MQSLQRDQFFKLVQPKKNVSETLKNKRFWLIIIILVFFMKGFTPRCAEF
jgi:hypothetical protein